jgi:hypothetical protein
MGKKDYVVQENTTSSLTNFLASPSPSSSNRTSLKQSLIEDNKATSGGSNVNSSGSRHSSSNSNENKEVAGKSPKDTAVCLQAPYQDDHNVKLR